MRGITPPEGLMDVVKNMTISEACSYYASHFPLHMTPAEIADAVIELAAESYRTEIPMKPGAEQLLRTLAANGIPFGAASANAGELLDAVLERCGVRALFAFLLTPDETLRGKEYPDLYLEGARLLQAAPADIVVFEDALYAAKTAKRAGFYTVGVFDQVQAADWEAMQQLCDRTVESLTAFDSSFLAEFV